MIHLVIWYALVAVAAFLTLYLLPRRYHQEIVVPSHLREWSILSLALSAALFYASYLLHSEIEIPFYERPAIDIMIRVAAILTMLVVVMGLPSFRSAFTSSKPESSASTDTVMYRKRPYLTLFIISFVALFVELMIIRYSSSQLRIFSFYKNVPLIACFLGLGLGCCLGRATPRHALTFLLWLAPFTAYLSAGSIVISNSLGKYGAIASSEQILGDFVPGEDALQPIISQLMIAGFCVAALWIITRLFALLGRLMGDAFDCVERLPGYTINITGSLCGILAFVGISYLEMPPWVWFTVGLAPLLWWLSSRQALVAIGLISINVAIVIPSYGDTVWSRYQKLIGHSIPVHGNALEESHAYLVEISDVFYQVAVDRRPQTLAKTRTDPFPHYDAIYANIPVPTRVLIVGAGTGNDVAAALRAGAQRIDAVDIDPAIITMGRRKHPERPYDDPRVRVIVDDARHAFRVLTPKSYDAVIFGLLDSHTQLGISSVRLDNYVFTVESFAEAARLVKPGGYIVITAATFRTWFRDRFETMLQSTVKAPIQVLRHGMWVTYLGQVGGAAVGAATLLPAVRDNVSTDDWPFLYLPERAIPQAYLWVVVFMMIASILVLKRSGLRFGSFTSYHGHLFFLGAAFLLMEVHAINRLALLFGTTWLVSAVTIALVLLLIVCANFTVIGFGMVPYWIAYSGLALSLWVSFWIQPGMILGKETGAALFFGFVLLSPVFFAGLVFARSFQVAKIAGPAMGANIMGSVLGGWIEYSTMAVGMRALVLLAAGFYLFSLLFLLSTRRRAANVLSLPSEDHQFHQTQGD